MFHVLLQRAVQSIDEIHQLFRVLFVAGRFRQLLPLVARHFSHARPPGSFAKLFCS